jgi:hypothetical protein
MKNNSKTKIVSVKKVTVKCCLVRHNAVQSVENVLHNVISQKIELFITTAMTTSDIIK